jgi:uncharacterized membrane protein YqjE
MSEAAQSSPDGASTWTFGLDLRRLFADLVEMFRARRELAELELRADLVSSKRLAIAAGLSVLLALTSLPLLLMSLAGLLHFYVWHPLGVGGMNVWVPILGGVLLLGGTLLAWLGYRRFRREFIGLRRSLAEVREDLAWLQEWVPERGEAAREES